MNSQFEYQESLNGLRFTDEQKEAIARRAMAAFSSSVKCRLFRDS